MRVCHRVRQRGFQVAELLVALVLGLLLIAAFLAAFSQARVSFAAHESLASVQDSARHALSVLVDDLEHAGSFGFVGGPGTRAEGALPPGAEDCWRGIGDLALPVRGSNNAFVAGPSAAACAPTASAGGARPGADSLGIRRASRSPTAPLAGRVQIYARRLASREPLQMFANGRAPGPVDRDNEIRDLEARVYYVANDSVGRPGWPALRVKALTESRGAPQFRDEEVMPGVEDLQVEFGIAAAVDGVRRVRFVPPDSAELPAARIVAVRLWLRIRAEVTEPGYLDDAPLDYADAHFVPSGGEARQRRMLVERTVALRNAG